MLYLPLISRLADKKTEQAQERNKLSHCHSSFCFDDLSFEFFHHFILDARARAQAIEMACAKLVFHFGSYYLNRSSFVCVRVWHSVVGGIS